MPTVVPAPNPFVAAPAAAPSHNPFDDFAPAPAPASQPPMAPAANDFALLIGSSPSKSTAPPADSASSITVPSAAAQDFDDFLANLEKKK